MGVIKRFGWIKRSGVIKRYGRIRKHGPVKRVDGLFMPGAVGEDG